MTPLIRTFLLLAALGGCASQNHPLPMVKDDDPVFRLNPEQWGGATNDLTQPPEDNFALPRPIPVNADKRPTP